MRDLPTSTRARLLRESTCVHRMKPRLVAAGIALAVATPSLAWANEGTEAATTWLALGAVLSAAMIAGDISTRLKQPAVLGEVMAGVVLANLGLLGIDGLPDLTELFELRFLAELGVLMLLFQVGLESTLSEMRNASSQAASVALIGVVMPLGLGLGVLEIVLPETSMAHHLFVAAAMAATSVGITVGVLNNLNADHRPETKVLLGAAVLDDILGLVLLAVVVAFATSGAIPTVGTVAAVVGSAVAFLAGALFLGLLVMPRLFGLAANLRTSLVLPMVALGFCLLLSGLSAALGLAAIIGSFAAGLLLDEAHVRPFGAKTTQPIEDFVRPITAFFAPVFFVYTGLSVDLSTFSSHAVTVCALLTIAAVVGKVVSGLGAGPSVDRLTVGLGMVPRGEVGLIFANVGATTLVGGVPVIDAPTYGAVVGMVLLTTMVAPPLLAIRLRQLDPEKPLF